MAKKNWQNMCEWFHTRFVEIQIISQAFRQTRDFLLEGEVSQIL